MASTGSTAHSVQSRATPPVPESESLPPSPPPSPPPRACWATLPEELQREVVWLANKQDVCYWNRVAGEGRYLVERRRRSGPAKLYGKSLLCLSLVNKSLCELAAPYMFKELKSRRALAPIFRFSLLFQPDRMKLFKSVSLGGGYDDHVFVPNPTLVIPDDFDINEDDGEWQRWDKHDTQAVVFTFTLLPSFPNLRKLSLSSISVGILFDVRGIGAPPTDIGWASLPPTSSEECRQRRRAMVRFAPQIHQLYLCHFESEDPEGTAPAPARVALIVPLFTNLTFLWIFFQDTPVTVTHIAAIFACKQLTDIFLEDVGAVAEGDEAVTFESWGDTAPEIATLRITGSGPLWSVISIFVASLETLTVGKTSIDLAALSPDFPPFAALRWLDITQTPSETLELLTLLAPAPLDSLELNFSSASLPPDVDSSDISTLFAFIAATFPDAAVTITDDFGSADVGSTLGVANAEHGWTRERKVEGRLGKVKSGGAGFARRCEELQEELRWATRRLDACMASKDEEGVIEIEGWIKDLRTRVAFERD